MNDEDFMRIFPPVSDTKNFLPQFHENARLRFFFHPRNQKDFFLHLLTKTQDQESILTEAHHVLENRFETLGSGIVSLGNPINWHRDFKSGKEWPVRKLTTAEILDLGNPSDIKVPWELSRFHQLWWLGKAYWLTHHERYAEKFGSLVEDWIDKNPLGVGANWTIAMEAAIRACNLIAGYYLFCESKSLPPAFWTRVLKQLYVHGLFIEHHLEVSWQNGNHYLSDIVGLLFLGIFFQDTDKGKQWLSLSIAQLEQEMQQQVYDDGVNYEKSTSYHRLVLELFSTAAILCQQNRIPLSSSFLRRLERMFEFVQHYIRPDGSAPLAGDADDGRLFRFRLEDQINDHRHILSVGAILFNRNDLKVAAGNFSQDALWLFGGLGFERHQRLQGESPALMSRTFPQGGFYCLRGKDSHLFIDAGDIGMEGRGGHGHNDTLSFELWAAGQALIVDSGTYCYTSDVKARQEFRRTQAHNTIEVDGEEIAEFNSLWSIKEDCTHPRVLEWKSTPGIDILEAEHSGYRRLHSPVLHRRRVELQNDPFALTITDRVMGSGVHSLNSFFHFAPGIPIELHGHTLQIFLSAGTLLMTMDTGECSLFDTSYSPTYGVRQANKTLRVALNAQLPQSMTMTIRYEPVQS